MRKRELDLKGKLECGVYGLPEVGGVDLYGLLRALGEKPGRVYLRLTVIREEEEDEAAEK